MIFEQITRLTDLGCEVNFFTGVTRNVLVIVKRVSLFQKIKIDLSKANPELELRNQLCQIADSLKERDDESRTDS
jgi:hypothetical protein